MKTRIAVMILLGLLISASIHAVTEPFGRLTSAEKALLKPQIERWIHDQLKQDWSDMWEIQEQTRELKNELLLGRKDAPDMDRDEYVRLCGAPSVSDTRK